MSIDFVNINNEFNSGTMINAWGNNDELKEFILNLPVDERGWLMIKLPSGELHPFAFIRYKAGPRFCNATWTANDKEYIAPLIGAELTAIMTR